MDELIQNSQENTILIDKEIQPSLLRIHKKLTLIIFGGIIFLICGISAFYLGKQSVNNNQSSFLTPTIVTNQPSTIPTTEVPIKTITSIPTSIYQNVPSGTAVVGCPSVTSNTDDCKKPDCRCLKSIPPQGCPQGMIIICSNDDELNWPVKTICWPGPKQNHENFIILKRLTDGTLIYRDTTTGETFRGTENNCE